MSLHATTRAWWQARDARERRMLLLMCAAIAAFAWWYGLVVPLQHARDAARASHQRAADALATVEAGLARLQAQPSAARPPATAAALVEAVQDSTRIAGVAIARQREGDHGAQVFDIDATTTPALLAWLDRLREQHRLAPDALSVAAESGMLRVQARFAPPQHGVQ